MWAPVVFLTANSRCDSNNSALAAIVAADESAGRGAGVVGALKSLGLITPNRFMCTRRGNVIVRLPWYNAVRRYIGDEVGC